MTVRNQEQQSGPMAVGQVADEAHLLAKATEPGVGLMP